jgi:ribosome-binding protein aMBF1 (putative translation factor)
MNNSKTSDALEIIYREFYEGKPERIAELEEARVNDDVARQVRELREEAGLSQQELAEIVGTTASVICRLEDADYEGHSLSMLNRIASAFDKRIKIDFVPTVKPNPRQEAIS